jgi:prepilin-type N-terminal cleavage/methylation domain-containing protein
MTGRRRRSCVARPPRVRRAMTLVEVIVAMTILSGVLLGMAMFAVRLSQETSAARLRATAAQLVADRIEVVKGAPRYDAIDSLYVKTETAITGFAGYTRQTMVNRIGGLVTDTIDYRIVTVEVRNARLPAPVRRTTIIAPF